MDCDRCKYSQTLIMTCSACGKDTRAKRQILAARAVAGPVLPKENRRSKMPIQIEDLDAADKAINDWVKETEVAPFHWPVEASTNLELLYYQYGSREQFILMLIEQSTACLEFIEKFKAVSNTLQLLDRRAFSPKPAQTTHPTEGVPGGSVPDRDVEVFLLIKRLESIIHGFEGTLRLLEKRA